MQGHGQACFLLSLWGQDPGIKGWGWTRVLRLPECRLLPKGERKDLRHLIGSQISDTQGAWQELGRNRELQQQQCLVLAPFPAPLPHPQPGCALSGIQAHLVVGHVEVL